MSSQVLLHWSFKPTSAESQWISVTLPNPVIDFYPNKLKITYSFVLMIFNIPSNFLFTLDSDMLCKQKKYIICHCFSTHKDSRLVRFAWTALICLIQKWNKCRGTLHGASRTGLALTSPWRNAHCLWLLFKQMHKSLFLEQSLYLYVGYCSFSWACALQRNNHAKSIILVTWNTTLYHDS